ncbi:GNAT family N-acetyltransferase [Chromobacterium haemolyticum]|uniref:GNAT family N-acetyltransferase n=1 Tax=Chromobacterium fluminis TaxID=3044269 RepID=A0ABX0KX70_9NEIS|nr:GNAT family N-acetyltransferase [Chromobacterium haemolyticum]NHR04075.1 GNAT family N-acetyltransferase [Chromobacterium haemolyticum]
MKIRPAAASDLPAICRLADEINLQHHLALPHTFAANGAADRDSAFWAGQLNTPNAALLLAETDGEVTAFVALTLLDLTLPFLLPRRICRVATLVVTAEWRGQGHGSALLNAAEDWARRHSADEIRLEVKDFNQAALNFYLRRGLEPQSRILGKRLDLAPAPHSDQDEHKG